MALLSRLAPELNGKRKREVDGYAGGSLKKLMSSASIRSSLTTFPASLYVGHRPTNGRTAETSPSYDLRSALQLSGTELYAPELPSRASQAVLQQLSPIFHPESIKSRPELSNGATATACSTTPVKWNPLRSYPGKAQAIFPQQARTGNFVAGLYRSARVEAEVARLKEQMHRMARSMVQLQHETEENRERYKEVVQLVQQSADLRKLTTAALAGPSAEKASRKVVDDAGAGKEDRGPRDGHVHRNSPPVDGVAFSSLSVASSSVSMQIQRLHDLQLEDARQKSRDLEIKLKEAELAVQKQHRLKLEEPVEEEVLEEEEEETEEEEEEAEEELEQEAFIPVPLTAEEDDLVEEILDNPPSRAVVVSHEASSLDLNQEQMQCLRPETWLNDEVINLYMVLLKERESRADFQEEGPHPVCHFFNSFFYNKLRMDKGKYEYMAVQRWTRKKIKYKLAKCDKVIVPIHQGVHWALGVINLRDRQLEYFDSVCDGDSYPFSKKADPETVLEDLAQYIADESEDKGTGPIDTGGWKRVFHKDLPRQLNGSDCGMFMLKFADFTSRDAPINFSQGDMWYFRRKLVVELAHMRAD